MKVLLLATLLVAPLSPIQSQTGVVTGRLLSKDGISTAGVRVSAFEAPDSRSPGAFTSVIVGSAHTNADGRFILDNIPAGRYYITAGFVDSPTYYPGVSVVSGASAIDVRAGATLANIDFAMVASIGVQVSGRVILPANQPALVAQRVVLLGSGTTLTGIIQESSINPDGAFEFRKVRPGSYTLFAVAGFWAQTIRVEVSDQDIPGIEAVLVERSGALGNIPGLILGPVIEVTGRVILEGGSSALGPTFYLSFAGASRGTATLRLDGTFRTSLPAGEYGVAASALPDGYYLKALMAGSTDLSQSPLKVSGAASAEIVVTIVKQRPPDSIRN